MDEFGTLVDAHTVRFERLLPGPIERVWAYLTEPQFLRMWLAESNMDLRVGGAVELRFDTDDEMFPLEHGKKLVALIPNAKFIWLDGVGHGLPIPNMDAIITKVIEHVSAPQ